MSLREGLRAEPTPEVRGAAWDAPTLPIAEAFWAPCTSAPELWAWAEGNRTVVLDGPVVRHEGQDWRVSIKGVGAQRAM